MVREVMEIRGEFWEKVGGKCGGRRKLEVLVERIEWDYFDCVLV